MNSRSRVAPDPVVELRESIVKDKDREGAHGCR